MDCGDFELIQVQYDKIFHSSILYKKFEESLVIPQKLKSNLNNTDRIGKEIKLLKVRSNEYVKSRISNIFSKNEEESKKIVNIENFEEKNMKNSSNKKLFSIFENFVSIGINTKEIEIFNNDKMKINDEININSIIDFNYDVLGDNEEKFYKNLFY